MIQIERIVAIDAGEGTVLLLFQKGAASSVVLPGGLVPAHESGGPGHFAFAIDAADLPAWEARLGRAGDRRSRAASPGSAAAPASTSAIPTTAWWSWRRRACGRRTEHGADRRVRLAIADCVLAAAGAGCDMLHRRRGDRRVVVHAVRDGAARLKRSPSDTLVLSVAARSWPGGCPGRLSRGVARRHRSAPGLGVICTTGTRGYATIDYRALRQGPEGAAGDEGERRAGDDRAAQAARRHHRRRRAAVRQSRNGSTRGARPGLTVPTRWPSIIARCR